VVRKVFVAKSKIKNEKKFLIRSFAFFTTRHILLGK